MVGPTGQKCRGFLGTGLAGGRPLLELASGWKAHQEDRKMITLPAEEERELRRRLVREALEVLAAEAG